MPSLDSSRMRLGKIDLRSNWNAFWCWWREGLLACLPIGVRRWLADSARRLVVMVTDDACVLVREEAGQDQELERLERATLDWHTIAVRCKAEKPRQLTLRLPASQALVRTLSLPLAAEKNLRQVAGFEMDRLTPFPAGQVYYDVILLARQPEQRRLQVELTALPRAGVDPLLAQMQQQGLQADVLDVTGGRPGLNLLPLEQRARGGLRAKHWRAAVVTVSLLLVVVAMLLPIWQQRSLLLDAIDQLTRVQRTAQQSLTLRDQLDRAMEASQILMQKKQTLPARIDLLRELTLILPDDTWLERLQIRGDTIQLVGQSSKASSLVAIIEASPLFSGVGFLSPVTTDPRTGKERFMLGARIGKEH